MPVKPLIPNAETLQVVADGLARKRVTVHTSVAEWRKSLLGEKEVQSTIKPKGVQTGSRNLGLREFEKK